MLVHHDAAANLVSNKALRYIAGFGTSYTLIGRLACLLGRDDHATLFVLLRASQRLLLHLIADHLAVAGLLVVAVPHGMRGGLALAESAGLSSTLCAAVSLQLRLDQVHLRSKLGCLAQALRVSRCSLLARGLLLEATLHAHYLVAHRLLRVALLGLLSLCLGIHEGRLGGAMLKRLTCSHHMTVDIAIHRAGWRVLLDLATMHEDALTSAHYMLAIGRIRLELLLLLHLSRVNDATKLGLTTMTRERCVQLMRIEVVGGFHGAHLTAIYSMCPGLEERLISAFLQVRRVELNHLLVSVWVLLARVLRLLTHTGSS